jgi:hypothetical protein
VSVNGQDLGVSLLQIVALYWLQFQELRVLHEAFIEAVLLGTWLG